MPRFPVAFGRRKSTADNLENAPVGPSFRVLERTEVAGGKSFDGGARLSAKTHHLPKTSVENINVEDNIFADLKSSNRGSGSTNTTKTNSTDNSSRHSNASTAPSSADYGGQEEWKGVHRKPVGDIPVPPIPKSASSSFLKSAGRSFSFGGQKKHLPPVPAADESPIPSPTEPDRFTAGRARATTTSTSTTVTPPKVDEDFNLDLGGDFSKMLLGYDKRASTATMLDEQSGRQALQPRGLTGNRLNQPSPIQIDKTSKIENSPYSWNSHHSNDNLLTASPLYASPINENTPPPPVPPHASPLSNSPQFPKPIEGSLKRTSAIFGRRKSQAEDGEGDDEEARLLKDTLSAVNKFMSGNKGSTPSQGATGRYRRNEDTLGSGYRNFSSESKVSRINPKDEEDNLFDNNIAQHSRLAQRYVTRKQSPAQTKVMTPAEFERYRRDKERQDASSDTNKSEKDEDEDDDEDHYEDDEDEIEKSKQLAKQRRKQEAHMTVYRQQMMKVTGESSSGIGMSRPGIQMSFSTPNLSNLTVPGPSKNPSSENSDEDEEVPLAILAAHGFPNKNRPPTRLSNMGSNPNLREATQPSYQRPGSAAGDAPAASGGRLPPFARRLPQDPYGLVNPSVRESFALGGGAPAPGQQAPLPPGGLVGVIASEERSRALRRGSPQIDGGRGVPPSGPGGFDPMAGIPPQMMYPQMPQMPMLSPGDHAQIQMTQQMQQFMQMQMQFMQMMAGNQGGNGPPRSAGHMSQQSMGAVNGLPMPMTGMDMLGQRGSFLDNGSMLDLPRPDMHGRTMSMVQPSSASWIQPPNPGYAPSIRIQGDGYAPSIAPSERSNVGLPGRYRPVSQMPPPPGAEHLRKSSTMSGALSGWDEAQNRKLANKTPPKKSGNVSDEDDEEGWEAMKAKRDKKKSLWKTKKTLPTDLGALIS